MANVWVIRRTKDGMYYQDENLPGDKWASSLVTAHRWFDGRACSEACDPGEEWVELDDAGQPVEAKAVRMWVVRRICDGLYFPLQVGPWSDSVCLALLHRETYADPRDDREWAPVLVHPDGTVTLDEPAPAVAQPSPYSADEPIPYKLTEPDKTKRDRLIAEIAVHYAKASRHVRMASKKSRKLERLDAKIDSAKARLRGGK